MTSNEPGHAGPAGHANAAGQADRTGHAGPAGDDPVLSALPSLLRAMAESAVVELEVSVGDARLYLRQRPGAAGAAAAPAAPADAAGAAGEDEGLVPVTTPLSGVFYASAAPDEPPYVSVGDEVEPGQVVALVEAMKVFNEIHAETGGVVVKVLQEPGHLVQAGQPLILLRPQAGAVPAEPA